MEYGLVLLITNEHIVGTQLGIIKCRAIRIQDSTEQFSMVKIEELKGTPWQQIPNRGSMKNPTNIKENGTVVDEEGKEDGYAEENNNEEEKDNN